MARRRTTWTLHAGGVPIPQGSKTAYPRGGRCVVVDANAKKLKPWREYIAAEAVDTGPPHPLEGPVGLRLGFTFPRPKSHFTTRGYLTASAPTYPGHGCGDIDKLERAILDALTGVWFRDDTQVVEVVKFKAYGEVPGVLVDAWEAVV